MNRKDLKQALWDILIALDIPTKGITEVNIDRIVNKYLPEKIKEDTLLLPMTLNDDEMEKLLEDPTTFFNEWEIPSFSYDNGDVPEAVQGESMYIYINGKLYTFTIHQGDCIEASHNGLIYNTDAANFREVLDNEKATLNLVAYNRYK